MNDVFFESLEDGNKPYIESLRKLLKQLQPPFAAGDTVGIKLHWGEKAIKAFCRLITPGKSRPG